MNEIHYVPVQLPDNSTIWVEIDPVPSQVEMLGGGIPPISFEEMVGKIKVAGKFILDQLSALEPSEVEVSFGIKVSAEGGNSFWGLAKTSGEASYTVTLKWSKEAK